MPNSVYIACSMDGYIARPDGGLDWLPPIPENGADDYGYSDFMNRIDAVVMGRNTYEVVKGFGEWPYKKPVFVLSSRLKEVPQELVGKVKILSGTPLDVVSMLSEMGMNNLYVDGGRTIQSFLQHDLIDEIIITTISVILGEGIPLFGKSGREFHFRIRESRVLNEMMVQTHYVRS